MKLKVTFMLAILLFSLAFGCLETISPADALPTESEIVTEDEHYIDGMDWILLEEQRLSPSVYHRMYWQPATKHIMFTREYGESCGITVLDIFEIPDNERNYLNKRYSLDLPDNYL